jgi:hypothetical protein
MLIVRTFDHEKQSIGQMLIIENNRVLNTFCTLEKPDLDNKQNVSCIPDGVYMVRKRKSPRFGWCFIVEKVPNRSYILIHRGNYYSDIRGCILAGTSFRDINKDGIIDVLNTTNTVKKLLKIMPDRFELTIKST